MDVCPSQVTVMHSMQAGYLEKAQKYTDKALMQLEKLKSQFSVFRFLRINYQQQAFFLFQPFPLSPPPPLSVGLQPHPLYLSSHSAGAHHHVQARNRSQGHGATGGTLFLCCSALRNVGRFW